MMFQRIERYFDDHPGGPGGVYSAWSRSFPWACWCWGFLILYQIISGGLG